jgi:hypothetical protein
MLFLYGAATTQFDGPSEKPIQHQNLFSCRCFHTCLAFSATCPDILPTSLQRTSLRGFLPSGTIFIFTSVYQRPSLLATAASHPMAMQMDPEAEAARQRANAAQRAQRIEHRRSTQLVKGTRTCTVCHADRLVFEIPAGHDPKLHTGLNYATCDRCVERPKQARRTPRGLSQEHLQFRSGVEIVKSRNESPRALTS